MQKLLTQRRSIRSFKEKEIEKEKLERIIKCALLSPSSRNIRPWHFTVITDKDILLKLSKAKHGSDFLSNAPLGIVVSANTNESDVWIEDASIASIIIQISAEKEGLSSCWAQIRLRKHNENISADEYVKNILDIPQKHSVLSIVGIGYANEEKPPYTLDKLKYSSVSLNNFSCAYRMERE